MDRSALSGSAKDRARRLFRRLAETEADIHQRPVEEIHLHEVGAVDSIIDIAGAVFGLEWVGADRIVSSPLNVGSGTVTCAHGVMPVPAPATARLVAGVPVYSTGVEAELLTPTGALLVTDYASQYGPLPALRVRRVGYGAGDRNLPGAPNVVRVVIGAPFSLPVIEGTLGKEQRQALADIMMQRVADLLPEAYQGHYRPKVAVRAE